MDGQPNGRCRSIDQYKSREDYFLGFKPCPDTVYTIRPAGTEAVFRGIYFRGHDRWVGTLSEPFGEILLGCFKDDFTKDGPFMFCSSVDEVEFINFHNDKISGPISEEEFWTHVNEF